MALKLLVSKAKPVAMGLVDSGDVVVHIMLPQVRSYYDLESLWNGQRPE